MRRLALLLALLLGWPALAVAQQGLVGPGGIVYNSRAVDSTGGSPGTGAAQTLFSQSIGTGFFGTNTVHLIGKLRLSTIPSSPGTWTLASALGSGPSITFASAISVTANLNLQAVDIDCWVIPLDTTNTSKRMTCAMEYISSGTTVLKTRATGTGSIALTGAQAWTVTSTFSDTTIGTGVLIDSWAVVLGN